MNLCLRGVCYLYITQGSCSIGVSDSTCSRCVVEMQFVLRHAPQDPGGPEAEWIFQLLRTQKCMSGGDPTDVVCDGNKKEQKRKLGGNLTIKHATKTKRTGWAVQGRGRSSLGRG